jgi:mRNA interferase MazF
MNQPMQRGDIVLVRFPFTDLSGSKRRPAVILAAYPPDVVVAFISSHVPPELEPSDVMLSPTSTSFVSMGLKVASIIRLRKVATLEESLITRSLGQLTPDLLTAVDEALLVGLGIDIHPHIQAEYDSLFEVWQRQGETAVITYIQSKQ